MDDLVNHESWDLRRINTHSTKVPLNSHRLVPRDKCPLLWWLQSLSHKIVRIWICKFILFPIKMVLIRLSWFIKVISARSFSYWWSKNWGFWFPAAADAGKSLQLCPTLCDPIDSSPPGSPVPGILQARTLEWVAISFSNAWKWKVKVKSLSRVQLFVTPWTAAYQAPLSMGLSRQEYWSEVPSVIL